MEWRLVKGFFVFFWDDFWVKSLCFLGEMGGLKSELKPEATCFVWMFWIFFLLTYWLFDFFEGMNGLKRSQELWSSWWGSRLNVLISPALCLDFLVAGRVWGFGSFPLRSVSKQHARIDKTTKLTSWISNSRLDMLHFFQWHGIMLLRCFLTMLTNVPGITDALVWGFDRWQDVRIMTKDYYEQHKEPVKPVKPQGSSKKGGREIRSQMFKFSYEFISLFFGVQKPSRVVRKQRYRNFVSDWCESFIFGVAWNLCTFGFMEEQRQNKYR